MFELLGGVYPAQSFADEVPVYVGAVRPVQVSVGHAGRPFESDRVLLEVHAPAAFSDNEFGHLCVIRRAGRCSGEVSPSPKSQSQVVGTWTDSSLKVTVKGATPDVGLAEKRASGAVGAVTIT